MENTRRGWGSETGKALQGKAGGWGMYSLPRVEKLCLFRGSDRSVQQSVLGLVWLLRTCRVCGLGSLSHGWLDGSCALEGTKWTQCAGGSGARGRVCTLLGHVIMACWGVDAAWARGEQGRWREGWVWEEWGCSVLWASIKKLVAEETLPLIPLYPHLPPPLPLPQSWPGWTSTHAPALSHLRSAVLCAGLLNPQLFTGYPLPEASPLAMPNLFLFFFPIDSSPADIFPGILFVPLTFFKLYEDRDLVLFTE